MKNYWLLIVLSLVIGTSAAWTMNYIDYGRRDAYFGEITMDGSINADNVMAKLEEYHSDSVSEAELQGDPVYDFGAMAPGATGSHVFVVKNIGKDPLSLELGATTCKCTLGSLDDSELAPGESTSVELEWTVAAGKTQFEQSAELRTNDPLRPAIRLVVRGLVISDLEFEPKKIPFGDVLSSQPFEMSTKMYSYYDTPIQPTKGHFSSEELTKFSVVEFEEFEPSEADGPHKNANQAFLVTAKIKPGIRQGPMVTKMLVEFKKLEKTVSDDLADANVPTEQPAEGSDDVDDSAESDPDIFVTSVECAGSVIGALSMLETSDVKSTERGGYIWNVGRVGAEDSLEFQSLVALKGSERDSTNLTIGETYPSDVIEAKFADPIGKGQMRLFRLNMTLKASDKTIDLLGKNKDDFGWMWIESDNPKVSRMRVAVKLLIEPRP